MTRKSRVGRTSQWSSESWNWDTPQKDGTATQDGAANTRLSRDTPEKLGRSFPVTRSPIGTAAAAWDTPEKNGNSQSTSSSSSWHAGKGSSKGSRKTIAKPGGKGGESASVSEMMAAGEPRKPKDDVAQEIESALRRIQKLKATDFDRFVRQWLHAIHGQCGLQGVHDGLLMVGFYTSKKKRDAVSNWPAYISKLLKKYHETLKAEKGAQSQREQFLRAGGLPAGAVTGSGSLEPVDADVKVIASADATLSSDDSKSDSKKCPWLDRNQKIPDRVQVGQLMDRELHSEFICRVCLELCQDAIMLPCSHLFCRECTRTLVDWKSPQEGSKENVLSCPACRAECKASSVDFEKPMSGWLSRWINNMQVCCVFAHPSKLPSAEEDPLPPEHSARRLELYCEWCGPAANYGEHMQSCTVAVHLRKLQAQKESAQADCPDSSEVADSTSPKPSSAVDKNEVDKTRQQVTPQASFKEKGDFTVAARWTCEASGGDTAVTIEEGDHVYINELEPSGWARGTMLPSGRILGWLPYSYCRRRIYTVALAAGAAHSGYLNLSCGNRVVVYHREMNGWVYGAMVNNDASYGELGWFPEKALAA